MGKEAPLFLFLRNGGARWRLESLTFEWPAPAAQVLDAADARSRRPTAHVRESLARHRDLI